MNDQLIERVPLFAALPANELRHLAETLVLREFPEQALIFHEGTSDSHFFILVDGQVEIIKALGTPDERLLAMSRAVAFIGEMSLFSRNGFHTASVRARTPVQLLEMPRVDFDALLHRVPELAYELVRTLSIRLQDSENLTIRDLQEKNRQLTEAYNELKAAHEQIVEKEKLERELAVAREIQRSILPHALPLLPGIDLGAQMVPTRSVAGDFYDVIPLPDNRLGIVVGDVSDKGVPAALFMALTYSLVRAEASRTPFPCEVLQAVNHHLLGMNDAGMFVTMLYGVFDRVTHEFRYARAGHELPFAVDAHADGIVLGASAGQPLGVFDSPELDEQRIVIPPGGMLFVFTDGVTEARNLAGAYFGLERLRSVLLTSIHAPAQAVCQAVWDAVVAFSAGMAQQDDVTLLALRVE